MVKVIVRIVSEQTLSRKGYGHKARKRVQNGMGEEGEKAARLSSPIRRNFKNRFKRTPKIPLMNWLFEKWIR